MENTTHKLMLASDYQEGAHPNILQRMIDTNLVSSPGYGMDPISDSAKERIRSACECPDARVEFLLGGTQTNVTMIDLLLASYEAVIAADSGHVSVHEAGAVEYLGHKVIELPGTNGKISASQIEVYMDDFDHDDTKDHRVQPGMVYLSQPTEYGSLYSLTELTEIHKVCRAHHLPLYIDGARLAYALASPQNDVQLPDLARLCDAFYIGGTKCGAFFGEAVVVTDPDRIPHFFTQIKQHGALLAKGWLLGIQFDELFKDNLYLRVGETALRHAARIQQALIDADIPLYIESPTNQIFPVVTDAQLARIREKVEYSYIGSYDDDHTIIRFATSWATTDDMVDELLELLQTL